MVIVKTNPGSPPSWTGAVHKEVSFLQRKVKTIFSPLLGDLLERCCQAIKRIPSGRGDFIHEGEEKNCTQTEGTRSICH